MNRVVLVRLKESVKGINWPLLVFLLLFLNVKLIVKLFAVVLIYVVQPDFKFGFKIKNSRLPLFYLLVIAIGIINWIAFKYFFLASYNVAFFTGIGFWLLCILAMHQVKLSVEKTSTAILHRTIAIFFIINAIVSFADILLIMLKIGRINPYTYQGDFQKYFLNTGDFIKGISFDVSITNAVIAAFGVIYFLVRQNIAMVFICMLVLLLAASNTINILLFLTLGVVFIFRSDKVQKSVIVVSLMMLAVFMAKVSPQNMFYIDKVYNRIVLKRAVSFDPLPVKEVRITKIPDNLLNPAQRQQKFAQLYLDSLSLRLAKNAAARGQKIQPAAIDIVSARLVLPHDSIHTATFQSRSDTDAVQRKLLSFIGSHHDKLPLSTDKQPIHIAPGKVIAFKQTIGFLIGHPLKLITGDGIGNFSSKLAFRTTDLGMSGGYPAKFVLINPDFLSNHLDVYLNFFSKRFGMHSLLNSPDSVYDQLLAEYGIAGLLVFLVFYIGYFLKHYKVLTYGLPVLLFIGGVFFTDYWFEQLSVIIVLELLLFTDLKEHQSLKLNLA